MVEKKSPSDNETAIPFTTIQPLCRAYSPKSLLRLTVEDYHSDDHIMVPTFEKPV